MVVKKRTSHTGQWFDKKEKEKKNKNKHGEEGKTEAHELQNLFPGWKRLFEHIHISNKNHGHFLIGRFLTDFS